MGYSSLTFRDRTVFLNDEQIIAIFWHLNLLATSDKTVSDETKLFLSYAVHEAFTGGVGTIGMDLDGRLQAEGPRQQILNLLHDLHLQLTAFGPRTPALWLQQTDPERHIYGDSNTQYWLQAVDFLERLIAGRISTEVHRPPPYFKESSLNSGLRSDLSNVINKMDPAASDKDTEVVDALLDRYSVEDIMACLSDPHTKDFDPEKVGQLFDIMSWSIQEYDQSRFIEVLECWLEGTSPRQIGYALSIRDWYYYGHTSEMTEIFTRIATEFPQFRNKCEAQIEARKTSDANRYQKYGETPSFIWHVLFGRKIGDFLCKKLW